MKTLRFIILVSKETENKLLGILCFQHQLREAFVQKHT